MSSNTYNRYFKCPSCNFYGKLICNDGKLICKDGVNINICTLTCTECKHTFNINKTPKKCYNCDFGKTEQIILNDNKDLLCSNCKQINQNIILTCDKCKKSFKSYNKYDKKCYLCYVTQYNHTIECKICGKNIECKECNKCKENKELNNHTDNYCDICLQYKHFQKEIPDTNIEDFIRNKNKRLLITLSIFYPEQDGCCGSYYESQFCDMIYTFPFVDICFLDDLTMIYLKKTIFSKNMNDVSKEKILKFVKCEIIDSNENEKFINEKRYPIIKNE